MRMANDPSDRGFKNILIRPGENPQEFEKLKADLFSEYKPSRRSEEKILSSIASALWRMQRLQRLRLSNKSAGGVEKA
jgi:hypothetical protein